ncbi:UNVERIFIED_CONTAM: hypothetical protein Slati_3792500 [Sesamum latifolium]|uniref:RNase H type-1 domain-containing protein n=1 Tax=Sesamum latifolium TaxID=2727402 RepID=A0AAW2U5D2_9LAMI
MVIRRRWFIHILWHWSWSRANQSRRGRTGFDFKTSNNEAKYEALIVGIKMALNARARILTVYSNSQMVTNQVDGTYDVKEDRMNEYLQEISELKSFQLHQILNTENIEGDYLLD